MDHIAIMNKKWKLIPKILEGRKMIESRWSKNKIAPWNKIVAGDTVYFKDCGEAVTARARVSKVEQFDGLDISKIRWIWENHPEIGTDDIEANIEWAKDKKYCVLIYLEKPEKIMPFQINKSGFGSGAAWITIDDIKRISQ